MKPSRIVPCVAVLVMVLSAAGCQPADASVESPAAPGQNGGNESSGGSESGSGKDNPSDTGNGPGTGGISGPPSAASLGMGFPGVQISTTTKESYIGQFIAEYDHSHWWFDASKEKTIAVFDPGQFADYPNDHSLTFLSSLDVENMSVTALPQSTQLYRQLLRNQGIVMKHMPVAGPLFVGNGNEGYHRDENGHGDFAWDLSKTKPDGTRFDGTGKANEDYVIWDQPITLPMEGYVVEVVRDAPDNIPGQYTEDATNNLVGLQVGGQFYLYMLHMRQNSIPDSVKPGAVLPAGTVIGHVGNSGASVEPHLHLTLMWYDEAAKRVWSVPSEWADVWSASSVSGPSIKQDYLVPKTGTWISSSMF